MKITMRCIHFLLLLAVLVSSSVIAADRYDVPLHDCPSLGPEKAPVTIMEFIDYQ
jgi:hypothetical protein